MELVESGDGIIVLIDTDGHRHAVRTGSVIGLHETDEGTIITLHGGRVLPISEEFDAMLLAIGWRRRGDRTR
ncbi:hypothetical protein [Azospirillum sp. sgz301742]